MKTLNEQLNRIKSLMGDERLYGNLVDKKPINEWRKVIDDILKGGAQASKSADEALDVMTKAEKYFADLKAAKQIDEIPDLINDITIYKNTSYFDDILKDFTRNIDTVDDFIRHFDDFAPIYKASMTPRNYEIATKFMSKLKLVDDMTEVNIMKEIDGVPYFLRLPGELNFRWVIFSQWIKKQPTHIKNQVIDILNGSKVKNIEPIESTLHYPNKTIDDLVSEIGWDFRYFGKNLTAPKMSGWKFHVFGNTLDDSLYLKNELEPLLQKWGAYGKVGGAGQVERFIPGHLQHGKQGATIYIPQSIIDSGQQKQFYNELVSTLSNYKNKGGTINGDKMLTPQIHYRYELTDVIPSGGLRDHNHYRSLYNNASINPNSVYKPNHVVDLFSTKPKLTSVNYLSTKFGDTSEIIWGNVLNAKNVADYDKLINRAIETGDYSKISRGGFENYGIDNFREYVKNLYGSN